MCIYSVGLLMQVQNGKKNPIKNPETFIQPSLVVVAVGLCVCGCSRSHTRGSLYVMNNQPAGLGAACSSRVSQRLTDAALKIKKIKKIKQRERQGGVIQHFVYYYFKATDALMSAKPLTVSKTSVGSALSLPFAHLRHRPPELQRCPP